MGFSANALKAAFVHVPGLLLLSYLYKDVYEQGVTRAVLCTGGNSTCRKVVADLVPKGILLLEVGPLLQVLGVALALLYAVYLVARVYLVLFSTVSLVSSCESKDLGFQVPPGEQLVNNLHGGKVLKGVGGFSAHARQFKKKKKKSVAKLKKKELKKKKKKKGWACDGCRGTSHIKYVKCLVPQERVRRSSVILSSV